MQQPMPSEIQDGTLSLRVATEEDRCTVAISGELDLANAESLRRVLEEVQGELVLDMSELEFIDSTGIALLVAAHHRLNRDGTVAFRLIPSESSAVRRVMTVTGLDGELPFSADESEVPQP
jgi:anti-anti-sigma factor